MTSDKLSVIVSSDKNNFRTKEVLHSDFEGVLSISDTFCHQCLQLSKQLSYQVNKPSIPLSRMMSPISDSDAHRFVQLYAFIVSHPHTTASENSTC